MAIAGVSSSTSSVVASSTAASKQAARVTKQSGAIVQVSTIAKLFAAQPVTRSLDETLLSTQITTVSHPFITLPSSVTLVSAFADGGTRGDVTDDTADLSYSLTNDDRKRPVTLTLSPVSLGAALPANANDYLNQLKSAKTISDFDKAVKSAASVGISVRFGIEIGDATIGSKSYTNLYAPLSYTAPTSGATSTSLSAALTSSQDYLDTARKAPFNLLIQKDFLSLSSGEISKINDLVDKGMINSIRLSGSNSAIVRLTDSQLQKFSKLIGKLSDPTKFAMVYEKMSLSQLMAIPTSLMPKLEKPITISDTSTAITNPDAWNKLIFLSNAKMLNSVQLDTTNDTSDLDLTYSQLNAGSPVFSKISGTYAINVKDVTAENANRVTLFKNVKRIDLRDSIDNLTFLGTNLQKLSDANKIGSITTTSDAVSVNNTVAYFKSNLGVIGALARAGKLDNLTLTDLTTGSLSLTSQQVARNAEALKKLPIDATVRIQNSGLVSASDAVAINDLLTNSPQISLINPLKISDTASNLLSSENRTSINELYSRSTSLVSNITVEGDVTVNQAQGVSSSTPPVFGLKDFQGFPEIIERFRIKDTSENIKSLSADVSLNSKISLIKATTPITITDIFTPADGLAPATGFLTKGNLLAKLDSGFEVSDNLSNILIESTNPPSVPQALKDLALKGKLRTVSVTVPVTDFTKIDGVKQAFRTSNLGAYLSGFSIAGTTSNFISGSGAAMAVPLASKLRSLADSGLLKNIKVTDNSSVQSGIFLYNSLKGKNLDAGLAPLTISDSIESFGGKSTDASPRLFTNLSGIAGLFQNGKLASLSVTNLSKTTIPDSGTIDKDLWQQIMDRKLPLTG